MKDFIPKGTGNSRNLKSAIPAGTTWEQAVAQLRAGTFPIDLAGVNAAGVQQMGDALSKGNLLSDETCALLEISNDATPNDAFLKLSLGSGRYAFAFTVEASGTPVSGATITGVVRMDGTAAVTDENGYVLAISSSRTADISCAKEFADIAPYTDTLIASDRVITTVKINLVRVMPPLIIGQAKTIKLSPLISAIDVFAVGGGGSGGANSPGAASGGGGGYTKTVKNISLAANARIVATIGAGGVSVISYGGATVGNAGGGTSLNINDRVIIDARGGSGGLAGRYNDDIHGGDGGSGGGSGNYLSDFSVSAGGSDGSSPAYNGGTGQGSTTRSFGEASGGLNAGGGGCAVVTGYSHGRTSVGGLGGGGAGAMGIGAYEETVFAQGGTTYGGGGGGAATNHGIANSGAGRNGCIMIRW